MSVANEINRIKTNIANAYTKAEEKGATLPTEKNSANLADTIASITAGGGVDKPAEGQSGIVVYAINSLGKVIPNAAVNLEEAGGSATFGSTDENGRYYEEVFVGTWTVYMGGVVEGFDLPASQTVETKANEITTVYMIYEEQSGSTTIPGAVTDTLKGVLDGSLTELDTTNLGITKIDQYKFYNHRNLTNVNLTGVTDIGNYAFYTGNGVSRITNLKLNPVMTNIGNYAFQYNTRFENTINCEINGTIGNNAFLSCSKGLADIKGVITSLGGYAFASFGGQRTNPQDNINTFDFRNGTFTSLNSQTFYYNKYSTIRLPNTLKSLSSNEFYNCTNCDIYFYSETPPTVANSNAFSSIGTATNIFVPYNSINNYKTTTNFTTVAKYIKGFAPENTFVAGEELPLYDNNGYGLTWYSDKTLSTVITTIPDTQQEIYCTRSDELVAYRLNINSYNVNITVTDGNKTYNNNDVILNGTVLTITATGIGANTQKYYFTVNDIDFTSGNTYVVTDKNINIVCSYWDGVNLPVNPSFAGNPWSLISLVSEQIASQNMTAEQVESTYGWKLGDTKSEPLTTGETVELQIIGINHDVLSSDHTTKAGLTLQTVNCLATLYPMNATNKNAGGWGASVMRTSTLPTIKTKLSLDLQNNIKLVDKKAANGGNANYSAVETLSDDLFLLAEIEFFGSNNYAQNGADEGIQYAYWAAHNTNDYRKKLYDKNGDGIPEQAYVYFQRSSASANTSGFAAIDSAGRWNRYDAASKYGVSFALCI